VFEVDVVSVKKKMKDKAFARSVNRQEIIDGAQELAGLYWRAGKDTDKWSCFVRLGGTAAYYLRWVLQSCSSPSDSARAC